MLGLASHVEQAANTAYLWVWVGIGVITLIGFGITAFRWVRKSGADAAKLEARLASIETAIRPNGKDTQQLGDIAARTEEKLDALDSKLDRHIGSQEEVNKQMWREIRQIKTQQSPQRGSQR